LGRYKRKSSFLEPIKQNFKKRLSNTDKRIRRMALRTLVVIVGLFLIYAFFSGPYGFIRIAKLQIQKRDLIKENNKLLVELVDSELIRKRLSNDMKYIEYIARTRHFYSRPGEVIYRLKNE
jgi:cell division protein FtsB